LKVSTKVLDIDLADASPAAVGAPGYNKAYVLLRCSGKPVGKVLVDLADQRLEWSDLIKAIQEDDDLQRVLEKNLLEGWLLRKVKAGKQVPVSWSVVICTRDRPIDLGRCLDSLCAHVPKGGEIIVVDNASSSDATRSLVESYPVQYQLEERVGLNWARSKGARVAKGEVVIYTDDDVVIDKDWIASILEPFHNPRVGAVTGLVMPLELETRAQELFEIYGGFSRGFVKRSFDYQNIAPPAAGYVGAGANMALRRNLILGLNLFDAELDAGTAARTGGDAYAFYILLAAGYQIDYNPEALVFHRHRREYAELKKTLCDYTVGGFAFLTRCLLLHQDWSALAVAFSWLRQDHASQLVKSIFKRSGGLPLDLVLPQIFSVPSGVRAYFTTIKKEKRYRWMSEESIKTLERGV
jgi:glycosyltransferase involved in cell wall biosynthesis